MSRNSIDYATQVQFMYLFERVSEAIYFGPRGQGDGKVLYNVPLDELPPNVARSVVDLRKTIPPGQVKIIDVSYASKTYDLTSVKVVPKDAPFSVFSPLHLKAAKALIKILDSQKSLTDFFSACCYCRDDVNSQLWLYAVSRSILTRKDMKGFKLPAIYEILPDRFFNQGLLLEARRQARLLDRDRSIIEVDRSFTGLDLNPENKVAYFREDVGVNAHHWHWHLIFTLDAARGVRDRKGELFYYMHHAMLKRYEAERLSHGLARVVLLDIQKRADEGYFPKLTLENSGIRWGTRQPFTPFQDAHREADPNNRFTEILMDLKVWNDRILEAIDQGIAVTSAGQTIPLSNERGVDILGDMIEASELTPNSQFYGSLHNAGHNIIAVAHDPDFRFKENPGVMYDTATAVRDPVFWRWHKYIDELFGKHKSTLPPYEPDVLAWPGVVLTGLTVLTPNRTPNTLITFWEQRDIDLSRGLDFGRTTFNGLGPVWARFTHLQHEPFTYRIQVNNGARAPAQGTVRVFLAPREDEHRVRLSYAEQRTMFFEMDKFTVTLLPGANVIQRRSDESSVTIPWEQTFRDIERSQRTFTPGQAVCGCGWPAHLLVPIGKAGGMPFDLFVMLTNWETDRVRRRNPVSEAERQGCRDSASFCGLLDELYPDTKPMGFPFDRLPRPNAADELPETLDQYIIPDSNMITTQIDIVHRNTTVVVENSGAPSTMPIITQGQGSAPASGSRDGPYKSGDVIQPGGRSAGGDGGPVSPMDYRPGSPVGWVDLGPPGQVHGHQLPGPYAGPPRPNPGKPHAIAPRI